MTSFILLLYVPVEVGKFSKYKSSPIPSPHFSKGGFLGFDDEGIGLPIVSNVIFLVLSSVFVFVSFNVSWDTSSTDVLPSTLASFTVWTDGDWVSQEADVFVFDDSWFCVAFVAFLSESISSQSLFNALELREWESHDDDPTKNIKLLLIITNYY